MEEATEIGGIRPRGLMPFIIHCVCGASVGVVIPTLEEDIQEMAEDADIGMKKPHRKLMLAKWRALSKGGS